jgi:hypothetical protein
VTNFYYLYTPIEKTDNDENTTGGPICIKTKSNSKKLTYLGFKDKEVANYAITMFSLNTKIIESNELGKKYPELAKDIDEVFIFPNKEEYKTYLSDPRNYDYKKYTFQRRLNTNYNKGKP